MRNAGWLLEALLLVAGLIAMIAGCQRGSATTATGPAELRALRLSYEQLRARLHERLRHDRELAVLEAQPWDVSIGVRSPFLAAALADVTAGYFERIALDLGGTIEVRRSGKVRVPALVGRMTAGTWQMHVLFDRLDGVLRVARPTVIAGDGQLEIAVPIVIESGDAEAVVTFEWDAGMLAGLVCNDFVHTIRAEGSVVPRSYLVHGALVLGTDGEGPIIRTELDDQRMPIDVELSADSWRRVHDVINAQSKVHRCGLVVDESKMERKLRGLVERGFRVPLPKVLERSFHMPARMVPEVEVMGRTLTLAVRPSPPRLDPHALWYGAELHVSEVFEREQVIDARGQ